MSFFPRNREALAARGIDPSRLPLGQCATDRFPVLHAGSVPDVDLATWDFTVDGLVGNPVTWSWDEFLAMPSQRTVADIHCVTKWSKFDTEWEGVPVRHVWEQVAPDPAASHVLVRARRSMTAPGGGECDHHERCGEGSVAAHRRSVPRRRRWEAAALALAAIPGVTRKGGRWRLME